MKTTAPSFLPRTAVLSLAAGLVLPFLFGAADSLTMNNDLCAEYDKIGLLFVDVPNFGIAGAWLGSVSSLVSVVSSVILLIGKLRNPGGIARWPYGGWFFFPFLSLIMLLLNIWGLHSGYGDAVGSIQECI